MSYNLSAGIKQGFGTFDVLEKKRILDGLVFKQVNRSVQKILQGKFLIEIPVRIIIGVVYINIHDQIDVAFF